MNNFTHKYIVEQSLNKLLKDNKIPREVYTNFSKSFIKFSTYPDKKEKQNRFLYHFYDPTTNENYLKIGKNALDMLMQHSEDAYTNYKKFNFIDKRIIKSLSYACHYLADLNEPHHTSNLIGFNTLGIFQVLTFFNKRIISSTNYVRDKLDKSSIENEYTSLKKFVITPSKLLPALSNHMEFENEISKYIKSGEYFFDKEIKYKKSQRDFLSIAKTVGKNYSIISNSYSKSIANITGLTISKYTFINKIYNKYIFLIFIDSLKNCINSYNQPNKIKEDDKNAIKQYLSKTYNTSFELNICKNELNNIIKNILDNSITSTCQLLYNFFN